MSAKGRSRRRRARVPFWHPQSPLAGLRQDGHLMAALDGGGLGEAVSPEYAGGLGCGHHRHDADAREAGILADDGFGSRPYGDG